MGSKTPGARGCRYWLNLLVVGLVSFVILGYLGYLGLWVYGTARQARTPVCCITPSELGFDYRDVILTSDDGITLSGWYIPSQNGAAIVLLHGYGANRMEMIGRAGMLAGQGYGVLLYDERASGESAGEHRSLGWADTRDVLAAVDFLQGQQAVDPQRIGILGFSVGGQIALRAASQDRRIRAVVAEEPGFATIQDLPPLRNLEERWLAFNYSLGFVGLQWYTGVRAPAGVVEGLGSIPPRPIFFIATGPREDPGNWLVRHFYDSAGQPKEWWEVQEASHGQIPIIRPEEYRERILDFFDRMLSTDEPSPHSPA